MNSKQSRLLLDETLTTERMLAFVRSVLALASLVVAARLYLEVRVGYVATAVTLILLLLHSLAMSLVLRRRPEAIRKAAFASSFIEVILITALLRSSGGSESPFYLWYVFYVVSISLRYGLQMCILALAASIVLYTWVTTSPVSLSLAGKTQLPVFLGSTGFLFILAFLFGHMSEKQKNYRKQLAVVNDLGIALSSLSASAEIERELVEQTAELLQVEKCWFLAWPGQASRAWIGNDPPGQDVDLGTWSPESVIEQGRARMTNEAGRDDPLPPEAAASLGIRRIAAAPLFFHDAPVGVLYAVNRRRESGPFPATDLRLLELIASQAAPLLENARLSERIRDTAASEERLRIARDLHDNFLQTLAAIKLHLERCDMLIEKDQAKAREAVARTQEIAAWGLAEVRSYLSQLRLAGPEPERLAEAVTQFVEETAAAAGFEARIRLDLEPHAVPHDLCSAAFQILRELVNNAAKHARASVVEVSAACSEGRFTVTVADNGVGLDVDEARRQAAVNGHLGLMGVEERAKAFGGTVSIESRPGKGTTVSAILPLDERGPA